MFDLLNNYLIQHKSVSLPGLGTIYMEYRSASVDTGNQMMRPPGYFLRFDKYVDSPDRQFFNFLAAEKNIPEYEAIRVYSEFSSDLRDRITREHRVTWKGVGELHRDDDGSIAFSSLLETPAFIQAVPAPKVIHPDAKHLLLVGDSERTNTEMNEWLQGQDHVAGRPWWLYALIAAIIAILVLLFHFSYHGWNIHSTGNQQKAEVSRP